jgi:uncharacterized membrane protein
MRDVRGLDGKKGRVWGAFAGGLVVLVGGPVGAVAGALAGADAGTLAGKWIDKGFSDKFLAGLQGHLEPGKSALIVLVEHEHAALRSESLAGERDLSADPHRRP